jgi:hypothetical protein
VPHFLLPLAIDLLSIKLTREHTVMSNPVASGEESAFVLN